MENTNLIRNFAIIAHVDHGKSTLSDRMLEITNTIPKDKMQEQFLDQNPISRERGITIKLAPVRMNYALNATAYILNLIDTPGHVDFSYEVSRTLAACEGVVLLVDATKGIQAQTVAHLNAAKKQNLAVIPVINKIDMPNAMLKDTAKAICEMFKFKEDEILYVSAKTGENVDSLLKIIIERIPSPQTSLNPNLRALVFDAVYDQHKGVIAFVRVFGGSVKAGDKIKLFQSSTESVVTEVGSFSPFLQPKKELLIGEIGYIITGIKDIHECNVGDTITKSQNAKVLPRGTPRVDAGEAGKSQNYEEVEPLPGYQKPKPMVFFGIYPKSSDDLVPLKEALNKVVLTDSSLTFSDEHSEFLGNGFRVGFLGLLHAEIVKERIKQEGGIEPFLTMPQVLYEKREDGSILEPFIKLTVYAPSKNLGDIMGVCQKRKGNLLNITYYEAHAVLEYEMPYTMFIRGLSSELKSVSAGFASIDYELINYRPADLVNLEIKVNEISIDVLSELVYKEDVYYKAREKTARLKEILPRQQFRQVIQGTIDGKILSREEISPFRKDVLAKMSGGDRTRKDKLLKKQKKGKSKLISISKVSIPQEALFSFYSQDLK
ncbi:MAG: GTP-binding protein [Candidatus Levybacteria bacterium]|nr:GTP-binding protein [Candidatus Levybacteria bacterium]